ncbi:MAG: topoisomerase DNA-binding C4 zinc finger domain-containing protein [archaeon]|nr:topoisomerase DNA-binding C4 zinc finger domain-containing protein [archaeon]
MNCAACASPATKLNSLKQPVCSRHSRSKINPPSCPDCGLTTVARQGKFGSFWGCIAFPGCTGVKKI